MDIEEGDSIGEILKRCGIKKEDMTLGTVLELNSRRTNKNRPCLLFEDLDIVNMP